MPHWRFSTPIFLARTPARDDETRRRIKVRFDELVHQERIRLVTFHQSFSYEDFVEGLRATTDDESGQIRYEVVDGVFKSLCEAAASRVTRQTQAPAELGQRRVWKMSLGNTLGDSAAIYQECIEGNYVLLGYGGNIDFAGCEDRSDVQQRFAAHGVVPENPNFDYGITSVTTFVTRMRAGDLVVVSDGNFKFRAIGEIVGDYAFKPHEDYEANYSQMRPVKWLRQYQPSLPHTELMNNQFSQMTLYELRSPALDLEKLSGLLGTKTEAKTNPSATGSVFEVGQVFGRDYRVVHVGDELLELTKPNGKRLGLAMNMLEELAGYVREGAISVEDIRNKLVFDKVPDSRLEPYLVHGYNNILPSLVEEIVAGPGKPGSAVGWKVGEMSAMPAY
jgi:5-methylcytosine-specific restriction enzyme B